MSTLLDGMSKVDQFAADVSSPSRERVEQLRFVALFEVLERIEQRLAEVVAVIDPNGTLMPPTDAEMEAREQAVRRAAQR